MKQIFRKYNKIFFVGIGGISMSAFALFLHNLGKQIAGSDLTKTNITKNLKKEGIKIYYSHCAKNVKDYDLIVYSGAIKNDNPELIYARQNNIKIMERSKFLGCFSKYYKNVIAICGTHGKTTCTALLGYIFILAGLNPTIHLGGNYKQIGGNFYAGSRNFFITEACEYKNSFLELKPTTLLINNIESEHLDFFKNFKNELNSFNKMIIKTRQKCFVNYEYAHLLKQNDKIIYFNDISGYNFKNFDITLDKKTSFDLYYKNKFVSNLKMNLYGLHNIKNALGVISICLSYGININLIKIGLNTFENVDRRFEYIGDFFSNLVFSDYAHHPTEIYNCLKTCKQVFNKKVVCIFQPHTYSRTLSLINEFINCFNFADEVILVKTYEAREKYKYEGSCEYLKDMITKKNKNLNLTSLCNKKNILEFIKSKKYKNSILLFMGAGDIDLCARKLVCKK